MHYKPQPEKKLHQPIKSNKCVREPAALHVTRWLKQQHETSCTDTFAKRRPTGWVRKVTPATLYNFYTKNFYDTIHNKTA